MGTLLWITLWISRPHTGSNRAYRTVSCTPLDRPTGRPPVRVAAPWSCAGRYACRHRAELLDGDRRAGTLEGRLRLVGRLLVRLLQDRGGGAVHKVLGLLQPEAGEGANLLDDLDLLVAGCLEDDVELVLLLGDLGHSRAGGRRRRGERSRCRDTEGVLELLHELRELDQGHLLERVKEVVGAELRHDRRSFPCGLWAVGWVGGYA